MVCRKAMANNMRKGITPWLAYCNPRPDAAIRLFCFPYAGGGAAFYRNWSSELAPQVDVCPVQLPGRETRMREPAYEELGPLVEQASTLYPQGGLDRVIHISNRQNSHATLLI